MKCRELVNVGFLGDAHWMFDEGLWTVTDTHRIRVAQEVFTECQSATPNEAVIGT